MLIPATCSANIMAGTKITFLMGSGNKPDCFANNPCGAQKVVLAKNRLFHNRMRDCGNEGSNCVCGGQAFFGPRDKTFAEWFQNGNYATKNMEANIYGGPNGDRCHHDPCGISGGCGPNCSYMGSDGRKHGAFPNGGREWRPYVECSGGGFGIDPAPGHHKKCACGDFRATGPTTHAMVTPAGGFPHEPRENEFVWFGTGPTSPHEKMLRRTFPKYVAEWGGSHNFGGGPDNVYRIEIWDLPNRGGGGTERHSHINVDDFRFEGCGCTVPSTSAAPWGPCSANCGGPSNFRRPFLQDTVSSRRCIFTAARRGSS